MNLYLSESGTSRLFRKVRIMQPVTLLLGCFAFFCAAADTEIPELHYDGFTV